MTDQPVLLRLYLDPAEVGPDGYPWAWHRGRAASPCFDAIPAIKDHVRVLAGHRCVRCGHPFTVGGTPGEWSPCDERCTHGGPIASEPGGRAGDEYSRPQRVYAQWRILTVHHLNGVKHDCRWWNLVALCQRCHLTIQAKVHMQRRWMREHSDWFKPYAAGWYAWQYEGLELTLGETLGRLDELLALEHKQLALEDTL